LFSLDFNSYGSWVASCGRNFLFTKKTVNKKRTKIQYNQII